jgi:hypothetical protein
MTSKVYEPEEAKKIAKRIENIEIVRKNKKATCRRCADNIKTDIEIEKLLEHDDKLYYESLLED